MTLKMYFRQSSSLLQTQRTVGSELRVYGRLVLEMIFLPIKFRVTEA